MIGPLCRTNNSRSEKVVGTCTLCAVIFSAIIVSFFYLRFFISEAAIECGLIDAAAEIDRYDIHTSSISALILQLPVLLLRRQKKKKHKIIVLFKNNKDEMIILITHA